MNSIYSVYRKGKHWNTKYNVFCSCVPASLAVNQSPSCRTPLWPDAGEKLITWHQLLSFHRQRTCWRAALWDSSPRGHQSSLPRTLGTTITVTPLFYFPDNETMKKKLKKGYLRPRTTFKSMSFPKKHIPKTRKHCIPRVQLSQKLTKNL